MAENGKNIQKMLFSKKSISAWEQAFFRILSDKKLGFRSLPGSLHFYSNQRTRCNNSDVRMVLFEVFKRSDCCQCLLNLIKNKQCLFINRRIQPQGNIINYFLRVARRSGVVSLTVYEITYFIVEFVDTFRISQDMEY